MVHIKKNKILKGEVSTEKETERQCSGHTARRPSAKGRGLRRHHCGRDRQKQQASSPVTLSAVWASPTLFGPAACSPPGSAHGVLQARGLEWAATPSSRELPDPGTERAAPPAPTSQADSLPAEPPGRPMHTYMSCMCCICIYVHSFRCRHHYIVWLKLIQCYMSIVNWTSI